MSLLVKQGQFSYGSFFIFGMVSKGVFSDEIKTRKSVYETLCPNQLLVHKDCALFLDHGYLKPETYTTYHTVSADQI